MYHPDKSPSHHPQEPKKLGRFVLGFVLAGVVFYGVSNANTGQPVSLEAEKARLISGVAVVQDTTASAAGAIKFGASASEKPTTANTGVPEGTQLTVVNGDVNITQPGVYDARDYRGFVKVSASNVTLKRSKFNAGTLPTPNCDPNVAGSGATGAIVVSSNATNVLIEDSEVIIAKPHVLIDGIRGSNFTVRRTEVAQAVDGIGIYGVGNVRVEDSLVHKLNWDPESLYHECTPTHNDAVQIHYGENIHLTGNTFSAKPFNNQQGNAAIMVNQNGGKTTKSVSITGNWMDYGGCSVNVYQYPLGIISDIQVTNNTFGKNQSETINGQKCIGIVSSPTYRDATNNWTGNRWEDGSTPHPAIVSGG